MIISFLRRVPQAADLRLHCQHRFILKPIGGLLGDAEDFFAACATRDQKKRDGRSRLMDEFSEIGFALFAIDDKGVVVAVKSPGARLDLFKVNKSPVGHICSAEF
jgi:hypothetical protein